MRHLISKQYLTSVPVPGWLMVFAISLLFVLLSARAVQ